MKTIINKSMDLKDLQTEDSKRFIKNLEHFIEYVSENNAKISSWYGSTELNKYYRKLSILNRGYDYKSILNNKLDIYFPNFLLWEIYWVIKNINFKKNAKLLDVGGACSLFSLYLASKGVNVIAIDINKKLVEEANKTAKLLNLSYKAICIDAEEYLRNTNLKFDYVTSICVFEHIEINKRKRIIDLISKRINKNAKIAFTFDYKNPSKFVRINSPADVLDQMTNNNFKLIGNDYFYDNNLYYLIHPFYRKPIFWKYKFRSIRKGNFTYKDLFKTKSTNDYTFGALFLEEK